MSVGKRIEVELRVPLDEEQYSRLESLLNEQGQLIARENRFLIDYSTFIEGIGTRKLDVRVRVTNGEVEIVVKQGEFGGSSRYEAMVGIQNNDLESALRVMALLGYRRGVAADRGITRYQLADVAVAIQEVRYYGQPGKIHSRFFEAEILSDEDTREQAETALRSMLASYGFRPFSVDDWNAYIALLNKEANGTFDFDVDGPASVKGLGQSEH